MKLSKIFLFLGTVAMAVATAASHYNLDFKMPAFVGTTEIKPGEYRLELIGDKAIIERGKEKVEAPVKMMDGDEKYSATTVRYNLVDGKYHVAEIRLSGTKTRVVFDN